MDTTNVKNEKGDKERKTANHRHVVRPGEKCKHAKQLMHMKQQQMVIEKSLSSFIDNVKMGSVMIQSISCDYIKASKKREHILENLHKNVRDIVNEVKVIKSIISNSIEIQKLDVNEFKNRLVNFSHNIQTFKHSLCVQALSEEQLALEKDLKDFSINLNRYSSLKHSAINIATVKSGFTASKNENCFQAYKEIDDFHKLLAKTGHTENWSDEDHLLFIRTRTKCKTIPALVVAMQTKCPDLSAETIINHEAWYKIYLQLREKQRLKLKEWRAERQVDKSKKASQIDNILEVNLPEQTVVPDVKQYLSSMRPDNHVKSSTDKKKMLVERWKREKENQRAMDDEQLKSHLDSRRALEEKRRRARLKKIQGIVNEYKRKKCLDLSSTDNESRVYENLKDRCKQDVAMLLAFRKLDKEYVRRKIDLILRAKKCSKTFSSNFVRHKAVNSRHSTTLFNATKVWTEKCKIDSSSKSAKSGDSLYIKDIPRSCIHWRNEESADLNV